MTSQNTIMANPQRVFLIDDDEDDRLFFNLALDGLDYKGEIWCYKDGQTALERFTNDNTPVPDVIFLDWNMPNLDGRQCLTEIRKIPLYNTLPIIIISTSTAIEDKEDALRLGATYFLSKPGSILELQKRLQHLFTLNWKPVSENHT
jgi:CheY-like chemotaxis protein